MSNIFSFVFSQVSCAHAHWVPHAEALASEPETRVPSVQMAAGGEPLQLRTVCRGTAQVTELKMAAGSVQRGCLSTELWSPEEHHCAAAWKNSAPQPPLTKPPESSLPTACGESPEVEQDLTTS